MNQFFKKNVLACLLLATSVVSCKDNFPSAHTPASKPAELQLGSYVISYCWQDPEGRHSKARPYDKEVVVVISRADGTKKTIVRNKMNLPDQQLSDFVIYKNGCIAQDDEMLRYVGFGLSWRPHSDEITYSEGSDRSLTRFDSRILTKDFTVVNGMLVDLVDGYKNHFWFPRGIYWSADGRKFATLARDVNSLSSNGDNVWVYDIDDDRFKRITDFDRAGDFVANASWSRDGSMLAIEYRKQSGVGIARFDPITDDFHLIEVTNHEFPKLSEFWPYTNESTLQLILDIENVNFNGYISTSSLPIWINNDEEIIFAAADESGQGTLFVVNSDGSNLQPFLPGLSGLIFMPRLSPNGRTLAFVRYPGWKHRGDVEIGTVDIHTKEISSLIVLSALENNEALIISGMDWSTDGKYLTFSSNRTGESDVYILSSNGENWMNLTEDVSGNAVSPLWKP